MKAREVMSHPGMYWHVHRGEKPIIVEIDAYGSVWWREHGRVYHSVSFCGDFYGPIVFDAQGQLSTLAPRVRVPITQGTTRMTIMGDPYFESETASQYRTRVIESLRDQGVEVVL